MYDSVCKRLCICDFRWGLIIVIINVYVELFDISVYGVEAERLSHSLSSTNLSNLKGSMFI